MKLNWVLHFFLNVIAVVSLLAIAPAFSATKNVCTSAVGESCHMNFLMISGIGFALFLLPELSSLGLTTWAVSIVKLLVAGTTVIALYLV